MMKTNDEGIKPSQNRSLAKAEFLVEGAATSHDVQSGRLKPVRRSISSANNQLAPQGCRQSGKCYRGPATKAGGTAQLIGASYCRIRLNGKEATFSKKVVENTDRLVFPDP